MALITVVWITFRHNSSWFLFYTIIFMCSFIWPKLAHLFRCTYPIPPWPWDVTSARKLFGTDLTAGAIGCALSHMSLGSLSLSGFTQIQACLRWLFLWTSSETELVSIGLDAGLLPLTNKPYVMSMYSELNTTARAQPPNTLFCWFPSAKGMMW